MEIIVNSISGAGMGQDDPRLICHINKQGCLSEMTGIMSKEPRSHGEEAPSTQTFVFGKNKNKKLQWIETQKINSSNLQWFLKKIKENKLTGHLQKM